MVDLNKVVNGIKHCLSDELNDCGNCPYFINNPFDLTCGASLRTDVLELINYQQLEIQRLQQKTVNPIKPLDFGDDYTYLCDSCKGELFCGKAIRDKFCPTCGGKIDWMDGDGD